MNFKVFATFVTLTLKTLGKPSLITPYHFENLFNYE